MSQSQENQNTGGNSDRGGPRTPGDLEQAPAMVFVLGIVTCGLYIFYWYYSRYRQLEEMAGTTPTGNTFMLDLLLILATCTLWHVYVDYRISMMLNDLQRKYGLPENDTTTLTVVLDVAGYVTGYLTGLVSTAIHQDQINDLHRARPAGELVFS
ncbi:MAG: DUF4234 domain-containing protein [bacterium]|nr:DUF4234 domain-containing protein [bacterium]